ncbi:MAG: signal peptidase I [Ruminococcaceae bacterium]|nr:signal peptidase I [Oscillospiraceae bacterium]
MTDPVLNPTEQETSTPSPVTASDTPNTEDKKKEPFLAVLLEYVEILVLSVCAVLLVFTFGVRLCRVNGSSMMKTLHHTETLLTVSLAEVEVGDIIVFHQTSDRILRFNEPLVKRVIAKEGQTVKIDIFKGEVYVDGVLLDEPYISLLNNSGKEIGFWTLPPAYDYDRNTGIFETTVPEGCLFVMGDNRNNSADSRSEEVGFVDERRVLGKVVCRLNPYTQFG